MSVRHADGNKRKEKKKIEIGQVSSDDDGINCSK